MSRRIALFVCLLLPSAWLAWSFQDLPHLGPMHDDMLYWVGAKSLAERGDYRILSLPGEPFQTKYPPLYSAYLSLAWLIEPDFPANLPWAMLLQWLWTPVLLALVWHWSKRLGMPERWRLGFLVAFAFSPYVNFFAIHLLTEMMATSLVLIACWLALRQPAAAGLVTGLAFLARTACVPLYGAIPLVYAWQRRWRDAAIFLATSVPSFAAWFWWSGAHRTPTDDPALQYYTNYLATYFQDLAAAGLPMMIWKNTSMFLTSAGQYAVFTLADNGLTLNLARSLGLMSVLGVIRLARSASFRDPWLRTYIVFAALYVPLLLIWNYPPDARFNVPLVPLLLAGFFTEIRALRDLIHTAWTSRKKDERIAARILAPVLACAALAGVAANLHGTFGHLPEENQFHRDRVAHARPAYSWIEQQAPQDALFYSHFDALLYLYTGRHAMRHPLPAAFIYQDDRTLMKRTAFDVQSFARQRHLGYLFVSAHEPLNQLTGEEHLEFWRRTTRSAPLLYDLGGFAILPANANPTVATR